MKSWLSRLASLKLTVVLVLLLAVVLASGTILESLKGADAARSVYAAGWFYALLGVFSLNVIAALVEKWPRDRWRIGFVITHAAMLVILFGALATLGLKIEGRMPIPEGQQTGVMFRGASEAEPLPYRLPFEIRLQSFEIDTYPGTQRPAQFRSRVVVVDQANERPAVIQMNQPLSYGGYTFFQSSYHVDGGIRQTILSVSRDPGQPIVFVGYTLLVLGMIVVFATRIIQYRRAFGTPLTAMAALLLAFVVPSGSLTAAPAAPAASPAAVPDAASVDRLRALPVQHDGRTMPLDTQARNDVWAITKGRGYRGIDPTALVLGWTFEPRAWSTEPLIRLRGDVAEAVGMPAGVRQASLMDLVSKPRLFEAFRGAHDREHAGSGKPAKLDQHLIEFEETLITLDAYFAGRAIHALPQQDPRETWGVVRPRSAAELTELAARIRQAAPAGYPQVEALERELTYNRTRPSRIAWILLVTAVLVLAVCPRGPAWTGLASLALTVGFAVMTWGIALRWQAAGRIPASNMYESMLFLAWGVGLFGLVAVLLRNRLLIGNAAGMAATAMLLVDLLPMDPFIHPMPPVLSGTPWLAIHVPIIMVSYSVYALATVLGHMVIGAQIFAPARRDLVKRWSQLLYWYLHAGSILLIAGILTGSIWAASSWGRYWGWDPKEVWSLVAFLAYMAILHARSDSQVAEFGVAAGSIAAFWAILMTYLGVNYVLAAGLHSYGFGSSSLVQIMGVIALVEVAFVGAGWRAARRRALRQPMSLPVLARPAA